MRFSRKNPRLFSTTKAGLKDFDNELNDRISDLNAIDDKIEEFVVYGIPGVLEHDNVHKVPVTDGKNLLWSKLDSRYFAPDSLHGEVLANASISNRHMAPNSVGTDQLIDGCITRSKLAPGIIGDTEIKDNSIPISKLRSSNEPCLLVGSADDNSYHELSFIDYGVPTKAPDSGNITTKTIDYFWNAAANNTFDGSRLKIGSIKIEDILAQGSVGSSLLADNAITTRSIGLSAVTNEKIANSTITGDKIANSAITGDQIANSTITGDKISQDAFVFPEGSISGTAIKDNTIQGTKIVLGSIPGDRIAEGTVTATKLANNSVENDKIKDDTITGEKIVDNSIHETKIIDGSISSSKVTGQFTPDQFLPGSINTEVFSKNYKIPSTVFEGRFLDTVFPENMLLIKAYGRVQEGSILVQYNCTITPSTGNGWLVSFGERKPVGMSYAVFASPGFHHSNPISTVNVAKNGNGSFYIIEQFSTSRTFSFIVIF